MEASETHFPISINNQYRKSQTVLQPGLSSEVMLGLGILRIQEERCLLCLKFYSPFWPLKKNILKNDSKANTRLAK